MRAKARLKNLCWCSCNWLYILFVNQQLIQLRASVWSCQEYQEDYKSLDVSKVGNGWKQHHSILEFIKVQICTDFQSKLRKIFAFYSFLNNWSGWFPKTTTSVVLVIHFDPCFNLKIKENQSKQRVKFSSLVLFVSVKIKNKLLETDGLTLPKNKNETLERYFFCQK